MIKSLFVLQWSVGNAELQELQELQSFPGRPSLER